MNICTNKQYQKSAQQAYNNTSQEYTENGTTLNILGSQCTDCGCSIHTTTNGMQIKNSGLYHISVDVTSTPSNNCTQVLQFYKNGIALPCAISTYDTTENSVITQHIETVLPFSVCCAIQPTISVNISGTNETVSFIRMSAIRLA